jgi:hypothetical protein
MYHGSGKGTGNGFLGGVVVNAKFEPIALEDGDRKSLSEVLGVAEELLILPESKFAAHFGCSARSLETMLKTEWVQHDIRAVLEGTEKVACQPWLLLNEQNRTVRLFSPSGATLLADAHDEIEWSAQFEKPGQTPVSAAAVLDWWDFLEQQRKLFMDACRAGRAYHWRREDEAVALQCVAEIEKRIPPLNSLHLLDVPAQWNAMEKCTVMCCQLSTYCGDVANAARLAELITHHKNRWAALVEALCCTRWLDSERPLAYLNRTTQTIYRQVQPDSAGLDSQGMGHLPGEGVATKITDALRGFNTPRSDRHLSLGDLVEQPSEALLERRFTQGSVANLEEAARKDPRLAAYINEVIANWERKPADIWRELGWNEREGKAVDRQYRRLRKRLKAQGVGLEWCVAPVPSQSDANQFVCFEVLEDGARGPRWGVHQHKPLKLKEE